MTIRLGMVDLITRLRSLTSTSPNDVTIDAVVYWSDDQLQSILDRHSKLVRDVILFANPLVNNGITSYTEFFIPKTVGKDFETAATSGQFILYSTGFVVISSGLYTVDYNRNVVTFTSDYGSPSIYLRATVFDINASASEVWLEKAAHRAALIDWKSGGQNLNEDQEYQHCLQMAGMYQAKSGLKFSRFWRGDYGSDR